MYGNNLNNSKEYFKYDGKYKKEISFPLGGIGTGCIGLGGNGRLLDWEIFNKHNKGGFNGLSHFAVKAELEGKAIDTSIFIDKDEKKYLYYSKDCSENLINDNHRESHIYGLELADNLTSIKSKPFLILKPEQDWEKITGNECWWNEGPIVIKNNDLYYLFFSANFYNNQTYSIGYATSKDPLGPFKKNRSNPLLKSIYISYRGERRTIISGPGHNSFTLSPDGKELFIVYHTHMNAKSSGEKRQINIDRMGFRNDSTVYINGPTIALQPLPSDGGDYYNIALEARITSSSTKKGYNLKALVDGEYGFNENSIKHDWVSDGEKEGAGSALIGVKKNLLIL